MTGEGVDSLNDIPDFMTLYILFQNGRHFRVKMAAILELFCLLAN